MHQSLGINDKRAVYGVLLCKALTPDLKNRLKHTGLAEVFVCRNNLLDSFIPEIYVDLIEECVEDRGNVKRKISAPSRRKSCAITISTTPRPLINVTDPVNGAKPISD